MLHLLGAVLVVIGMVGFGMSYLERERQRISLLEKWEYIMELYLNEIIYKKQPLSLASIEVGRKIQGCEGEVLRRIGEKLGNGMEDFFSEVWKKEWKNILKELELSKEEKELVIQFQTFTGFENEEIQKNMILVQQEKWKKIRERAQDENREKKKIILVLSFSVGMLIVLILL